MAIIKSADDIKYIREGGQRIGEILDAVAAMVEPGITTAELDAKAEELIKKAGGRPAFKGYAPPGHSPFPGTLCTSRNDEIVHGVPHEAVQLRDGDIFSMDIGMQYPLDSQKGKNGNGFFTDTALTVIVGEKTEKRTQKLLSVTQQALHVGIDAAQPGNTIADIGKAIEQFVKPHGFGIVRDLVGHGVGHDIHEEPAVPNYFEPHLKRAAIQPGMVIAIEPMLTLGRPDTAVLNDGWTIVTQDHSLAAHFEHTIIITEDGPEIATLRPSEQYI